MATIPMGWRSCRHLIALSQAVDTLAQRIKAASIFLEYDTATILFIVKLFTADTVSQLASNIATLGQSNIRLPTMHVQVRKVANMAGIAIYVIIYPCEVIRGYWVLHDVFLLSGQFPPLPTFTWAVAGTV
jgi:hypothetical protein